MPTTNNKVRFKFGTASAYTSATKDPDTIYFTTDDKKIHVGSDEYGGGTTASTYTPVAYDSNGNVIDLIGFGTSHYTKTGSQVNVWLSWSSSTAPASITLPFTSPLSLEMVGTWVDTYAGPDYGKMAPVYTYGDGSRIVAFNGNFNLEGRAVISYYI